MSGLYVVAILVIGSLIVFGIWRGAKRRKELAAWASGKGLYFRPERDGGFDERYPDFGCLRRGHSRYASNIAEGDLNGRRVTAFEIGRASCRERV